MSVPRINTKPGCEISLAPVLRLVDNVAPPAEAIAHARFVPASVTDRAFATFAAALGDRPASRDVSRTVARLRDRDRGPLDLLPYELSTGPIPTAIPLAAMRESGESMRRIERAAFGLAAVMLVAGILRVGLGL